MEINGVDVPRPFWEVEGHHIGWPTRFYGPLPPLLFLSSFVHLSITVSERHKGKKPCPFFSRPFLFDFHHMQEIIQRNEQKRGK